MPAHEQGFDFFPILACLQFGIAPSVLDIRGGIQVSVCLKVTDLAAKRLLIRSIRFIDKMAHAAFLRGVGALHPGCRYASFGGIPSYLFGDMRKV